MTMNDTESLGADPPGTVEVRVYRNGELLHSEVCESEEQAASIVDRWAEYPETTFEVDDLSIRHRPDEVLAPEPPCPGTDYPTRFEPD